MNLSNDSQSWKVAAGLALAGVLLFGASWRHPFHFDDALITNDSNVTNPARWANFFNPLHLRQLTFFTFYLNHLVGGTNPAGYHVVNVVIHIANAVLFFFLLGRFVERWVAVTAAVVFLLHPIQTEPVLYVYQRSILLACFFSLLAVIALVERRRGWAALLFFCAFESKESAIAVPLALALLGGSKYLMGDTDLGFVLAKRMRIALMIGCCVFAAATLGLLMYMNERTVGIGAVGEISPLRYLYTETRVIFTYLRLLVWPHPQSIEYEFQNAGSFLSVAGIIAILIAGYLSRTNLPGICILAFFVLLAPTSSIIPSTDAAFEHRLYLPMLAFSVFLAQLISRLRPRTWVTVAVCSILAVLTLRRETVWSSDVRLWEDTVHRAPGKARAWFNLGGAYLEKDKDKARTALLRTLELQPHFPEALYDLGIIEQGRNNWSAALGYYQRAVEQSPDYWPAWNNMGNTLFAMGQSARSLQYFEKTLNLNPDYWPAQYNIAIVHYMKGRYRDALPKLKIVLDWRPDFREARYLMAVSLMKTGNGKAAELEWTKLGEVNATESRLTPTTILAPSRP
jgi:protein O-mannosyl-transferase